MSTEKYLPDASAEGAGDGGEMGTRRAGAADGAVERVEAQPRSAEGAGKEAMGQRQALALSAAHTHGY